MGGTNMSAGLNLGFRELKKSEEYGTSKKIFLFSDGYANEGISKKDDLERIVSDYNEAGIGTSAFGLGLSYDENLMKGIARAGHGIYFFVEISNIGGLLEKAMRGLTRTVATDVRLKLISRDASTQIIIDKVITNEGIVIGDLRESDLKQLKFAIEVNVPEYISSPEVLTYELRYNKLHPEIPDSPISGVLQLSVDENRISQYNDDVLVQTKIKDFTDLNKKVTEFIKVSNYKSALECKQNQMDILLSIEQKDKLGFAKVLLLKTRQRMKEIYNLIINPPISHVSSAAAKKLSMECAYEEDFDDDMGYDLFG